MQAPPGRRCSERAVVVCMPRLSCSRTAPVSCTRGAEQGVGQGRLAGARRAEHDQRPAEAGDVREARAAVRIGGVDDEHLDAAPAGARAAARGARRAAPGRRRRCRPWSARPRRDAAGVDERQIALEAAQVEVVVEAHDEQRRVDVADDRMAAAVAVAAGDVRRRRHALVHPGVAAAGRAPRAPSRRRRAAVAVDAVAPGAAARAPVARRAPSCSCDGFAVHAVTRSSASSATLSRPLARRARAVPASVVRPIAPQAIEIEVDHVRSEVRCRRSPPRGQATDRRGEDRAGSEGERVSRARRAARWTSEASKRPGDASAARLSS